MHSLLTGDHGFGMGQGMGIGLPIVLGYVLWDWAGRRTRKRSMYDHGLVWPLAMSSLGWLMGIWILGAGLVSGPDHRDMIRLGAGIALVSCIPVLIAWFPRRRRGSPIELRSGHHPSPAIAWQASGMLPP
ncbi:MAG: hypothetical protein R3E96_02830 [Planctomycetota bacterium]